MNKIVIFGNCQAIHLSRILSALLPPSEFEIHCFSNNDRTGNKKSNREIIAKIRICDLLLYQPLSISHGELSDENIKNITKRGCIRISFPYVFNSGIYSLCHAPLMNKHKYGMIFGEEAIINQILIGKNVKEVLCDYKSGNIEFNLMNRFKESLAEMKRRESVTRIKLTGFIERKYKDEKLFITHNHPTNLMFFEMIRQIMDILPLPINQNLINKLKMSDLPETNCPITPYDTEIHGYKFKSDKNWKRKGTILIRLIVDNYYIERSPVAGGDNRTYKNLFFAFKQRFRRQFKT